MVKSDGTGDDFQNVHVEHYRHLFSICTFNDYVITSGYNRSLVCYDLAKDCLHYNLPNFASRVTCLASNVIDPGIIALGSGDGMIRVWKIGSNKSMFEHSSIMLRGMCKDKCRH